VPVGRQTTTAFDQVDQSASPGTKHVSGSRVV